MVATTSHTLLTVDQLIEGRHFEPLGSTIDFVKLDLIARKAMARSFSDIAAMAGRPMYALATAAFGPGFADEAAKHLANRLHAWGAEMIPGHAVPVVGGDVATTSGPLVLTVTMLGEPHALTGPIQRSGAQVGDEVYVTGNLGGSLASGRHLTFVPRVVEALNLAKLLRHDLHAMMDLSDGLGLDSDRLAVASGVRIEIDADRLPRQDGVSTWQHAASDGEDYELLLTVREGADVPKLCPGTHTPLTRLGRVVALATGEVAGSCFITPDGQRVVGRTLGWSHR